MDPLPLSEKPADETPAPRKPLLGRLGVQLFVAVLVINLATFALAGALLVPRLSAERDAEVSRLSGGMIQTLRGIIRPERDLNVAAILEWSGWQQIEDAVLVDANLSEDAEGVPIPQGIHLNPVGAHGRPLRGQQPLVLRALSLSQRSGATIRAAGGWSVPIQVGERDWGACWFRLERKDSLSEVARTLLPGFLLSTLLFSVGTFFAVRGLVLGPVERLAGAVRRVAKGDLSARADPGGGSGEMAELVVGFNRMTARVEGFNRELEVRVDEATRAAREAEAAVMIQRRLAAMGELAAGIAHEINNPLGGLQNAVRSLGKEDLPPERRSRYLELLADGLERIRGTVGQVLRMAPRETDPVLIDLVAVARDAIGLVRHRAQDLGVELELRALGRTVEEEAGSTAGPRVQVLGARNELGAAALNLLVNAIDSLETDGVGAGSSGHAPRCTVAIGREDGSCTLSVSDNGIGTTSENLERSRDLFFTTKEVGRGTGLGLSIVHNIADTHGGRLELESSSGAGFTARIVFPRPELLPGADGEQQR